MADSESVKAQVISWLEEIVIGLNLCPFARQPWSKDQLAIEVVGQTEHEQVLAFCLHEMHRLDDCAPEDLDTLLLVLDQGYGDFSDYLDLLDDLDALIDIKGWRGHFQLASFHPDYCFEGAEVDARENYTNRAPYPIIHVLRESSVSKARSRYPNTEDIPSNNIARLEGMSEAEFTELFLKRLR